MSKPTSSSGADPLIKTLPWVSAARKAGEHLRTAIDANLQFGADPESRGVVQERLNVMFEWDMTVHHAHGGLGSRGVTPDGVPRGKHGVTDLFREPESGCRPSAGSAIRVVGLPPAHLREYDGLLDTSVVGGRRDRLVLRLDQAIIPTTDNWKDLVSEIALRISIIRSRELQLLAWLDNALPTDSGLYAPWVYYKSSEPHGNVSLSVETQGQTRIVLVSGAQLDFLRKLQKENTAKTYRSRKSNLVKKIPELHSFVTASSDLSGGSKSESVYTITNEARARLRLDEQ